MDSDATQSAFFYKLWAWVDAHKTLILRGSIILAVVVLATGVFIWRQSEKQTSANEALSAALSRGLANAPAGSPEALLKVTSDYPGTRAAGRASLLAGGRFFAVGKYQEAREQFEKYLEEYHDPAFSGDASLGVAASLDAQGKSNEAITAYKDILEHHSGDIVGLHATVALGRLHETLGQLQQAHDYYRQIARPEYGLVGFEASMRLEELVTTHPDLIPIRAAPTNAPGANFMRPEKAQ